MDGVMGQLNQCSPDLDLDIAIRVRNGVRSITVWDASQQSKGDGEILPTVSEMRGCFNQQSGAGK